MVTSYKLISSEIELEGNTNAVYGIEAKGDTVTKIFDITADKASIERLISKCNELDLSSVHIRDICEDFLAYNY